MPNAHKNQAITPRPSRELHDRAKRAVADVGSNLNAHIIGFLEWLVGDRDQPPPRPAERVPPTSE